MLKRLLQAGVVLFGFAAMPSWAILIDDVAAGANDGDNVGLLDTFIAEGAQQGNPTAETTWVNTTLSSTLTFEVKTEDVVYFNTNTADTFAFALGSGIDYFLVKNATRIALFQNLAELDWGVFDANSLSAAMNIPDFGSVCTELDPPDCVDDPGFTISHVTQLSGGGGGTNNVPEPGMVALLAVGLLGMVAVRRKKTV